MATAIQRWQRILGVAASVCFLLLSGAPVEAQLREIRLPSATAGEAQEFVRSLDNVQSPTRQPSPLELLFPEVQEKKRELPAFFRDTDLHVHFRTFYFNREKS